MIVGVTRFYRVIRGVGHKFKAVVPKYHDTRSKRKEIMVFELL